MAYTYITIGRRGDPNRRVRDLRVNDIVWIDQRDCIFDDLGRVIDIVFNAIVSDKQTIYKDVLLEKKNDWTFVVDLTRTNQ